MKTLIEKLEDAARENYDSGNSMSYLGLPKLLLDTADEIKRLEQSQREVFKAGMIAMGCEIHYELTGITHKSPWNKDDEAILTRLYNEWCKNGK